MLKEYPAEEEGNKMVKFHCRETKKEASRQRRKTTVRTHRNPGRRKIFLALNL